MNLSLPSLSMLLDRARRAVRWAGTELRVWSSPSVNPFMAWGRLVRGRGGGLPRIVLVMALLWALFMALDWANSSPDEPRDWSRDGALCWIALALAAALVARATRGAALLRVEILKNRFEPLQILPLAAAHRAWLWCAPVTMFSLTVCALALPALAWGLGAHLFTLSDVLGLLVIALMFSAGKPAWRPRLWRSQMSKAGANSSDKGDGFVEPPLPPGAWNVRVGSLFFVGVVLLLAGVGVAAPMAYWDGLPAFLRATGEEFWLDWPLFGARWLTLAQPFFSFSLAPIVLVLPIWLANIHNGVLRLGAVTAAEPYWTPTRRLRWWSARQLQLWGLGALFFGLLWPGAIYDGWLGAWFTVVPTTREGAVTAWWLIALFVGAMSAQNRWNQTLKSPPARAPLKRQIPLAARALGSALRSALAVFIGSCIIGWVWPFGALWRQLLPAQLAVAAVWLGATMVAGAGACVPRLQKGFGWLSNLWFFGVLALWIGLQWTEFDPTTLMPQLFFLSPWTLWWTLRDINIASHPLFWFAIGAHCALIFASALALWSARATVIGDDKKAPAPQQRAPNLRELWSPGETEIAPVPVPVPAPAPAPDNDEDANQPAARPILSRKPLPAPDRWLKRILNWQSRFDNPLLRLESRRVFGNEVDGTLFLALALDGAFAFFLLVGLPAWGLYKGAFPFEMLGIALCIALLTWGAIALNGIEGASRCYDNDRVDGSLQMLFLTPLTEAEIAWGKLGPYLSRAALLLAFYAPLWLLGFLFSPLFREPLLIAVYAMAPLFTLTFTLRMAAVSHWMALKKRVVGSASVPSVIVLSAIVALPAEATALISALNWGAWGMVATVFGLALIFVGEAALLGWLSLRQLRRRRFLDAPAGR